MADNNNKWMPTAGGVINMVAAGLNLVSAISLGVCAVIFQFMANDPTFYVEDQEVFAIFVPFFWVLAFFIFALGIPALIGGIFAMQRKRWGWAMAGSICAVLSNTILGVIALIFVAMSRKEFDGNENVRVQAE